MTTNVYKEEDDDHFSQEILELEESEQFLKEYLSRIDAGLIGK